MVMIELRDSAYDKAFELLEDAKHSAKNTKLTLCELEDAMYECYEASKEEQEDYEREESDIDFRGRRGYRHDEHYGMHEDEDDDDMGMRYRGRMSHKSRLGMRRNRMGRFV